MKSVLFVTFTPLTPVSQGNARRVMQMVGVYKEMGYSVDLLYHVVEKPLDWNQGGSLSEFRNVWEIREVPATQQSSCTKFGHPDDWYPEGLTEIVGRLVRKHAYHALHLNYVWYSKLFLYHPMLLKVLDTHDSFADRHERFSEVGLSPEWYSTTLHDEAACLQRADVAIAIQVHDLTGWRNAGCHNVMEVPYQDVSLTSLPRPLSVSSPLPLRVGYCAANNDFNHAGLTSFLEHQSSFGFDLHVWGSICDGFDKTASPNVFFHGYSSSPVADIHRQVDVMINPMLGGTGLKIKNVECLLTGTPILSTSDAAHGMEGTWYLPLFASSDTLVEYLNLLSRNNDMYSQLLFDTHISRGAYLDRYTQCLTNFKEAL